jgi:inner membrane protein
VSSFIGHALSGLGIYVATLSPKKDAQRDLALRALGLRGPVLRGLLWPAWLMFAAIAPDLDHFFRSVCMQYDATGVLRITHSLAGCLLFPTLTLLALSRLKMARETRRLFALQVVLAGLSHVVMDLLVGVSALPLLWPFAGQRFKLPFGVLPSGPAFRLDNVCMYRNLLIEAGVLIPLYAGIYLARRVKQDGRKRTLGAAALWLCSLGFMGWASALAR